MARDMDSILRELRKRGYRTDNRGKGAHMRVFDPDGDLVTFASPNLARHNIRNFSAQIKRHERARQGAPMSTFGDAISRVTKGGAAVQLSPQETPEPEHEVPEPARDRPAEVEVRFLCRSPGCDNRGPFSVKKTRDEHERRNHDGVLDPPGVDYVCPLCDYANRDTRGMSIHLRGTGKSQHGLKGAEYKLQLSQAMLAHEEATLRAWTRNSWPEKKTPPPPAPSAPAKKQAPAPLPQADIGDRVEALLHELVTLVRPLAEENAKLRAGADEAAQLREENARLRDDFATVGDLIASLRGEKDLPGPPAPAKLAPAEPVREVTLGYEPLEPPPVLATTTASGLVKLPAPCLLDLNEYSSHAGLIYHIRAVHGLKGMALTEFYGPVCPLCEQNLARDRLHPSEQHGLAGGPALFRKALQEGDPHGVIERRTKELKKLVAEKADAS